VHPSGCYYYAPKRKKRYEKTNNKARAHDFVLRVRCIMLAADGGEHGCLLRVGNKRSERRILFCRE